MIDSGARQDHTPIVLELNYKDFLYELQCSNSRVYGFEYRTVRSFYCDLLGFTIEYERPEENFSPSLEDCQLMLEEGTVEGLVN